ncbi:MAG TPA: enoyl-CoA hydratase-related protein [Ktedonobacteraceae bacterium]|jgi:enoyl-CoA hydratase/carnithine racemase|nr:enoyl-CoA hydratase-related protein [Ktedonobacteraceae bacterium]
MAILYEKRGRVAYITINRPEARNAIDEETSRELTQAWQDFRDDANVWIGVLTGAGDKAFSAGADLKSFIPMLSGAARASAAGEEAEDFGFGGITRGFECWKPMIAAINGFCLAGGTEMMLACDLRIAAENATIGLTEVRWGIIPGAGGTQRLPRMIPLAKAMEIILLGEPITAEEAYRIGLVNKVVPQAELMNEVERWVNTLLERGPLALRAAKQAMLQGLDMPLNEGLKLEQRLFRQMLATEDAKEGPLAFTQKRKPQFKGQ